MERWDGAVHGEAVQFAERVVRHRHPCADSGELGNGFYVVQRGLAHWQHLLLRRRDRLLDRQPYCERGVYGQLGEGELSARRRSPDPGVSPNRQWTVGRVDGEPIRRVG